MLHLTTQTFAACRASDWQSASDTSGSPDQKQDQKQIQKHPVLAIVMFYAVWCGKCAMMRPVIENLERKYRKSHPSQIRFFEVETTESSLLAAQYQTDLLPAFLIFKGPEVIAVMQGIISEDVFDARLQKIFRNS